MKTRQLGVSRSDYVWDFGDANNFFGMTKTDSITESARIRGESHDEACLRAFWKYGLCET